MDPDHFYVQKLRFCPVSSVIHRQKSVNQSRNHPAKETVKSGRKSIINLGNLIKEYVFT